MFKSMLQELCQRCAWDQALYVTEKEGPEHAPRFTTKCTVKGICFESPKNECKSTKEAQNLAAKIAFEYLSAMVAVPHPVTSPSPSSLPAPGFVFSSSKNLSVKQTEGEGLQQKTAQTSLPGGGQSPRVNENLPKSTLHLFKNRLQHLAQKKGLSLPVYTSESEGPPHAPRFRATVTADGKPYKTIEFFSTLREAEHAAAKIAFESLSEGEIQEDDSMYKSLLQELAQKNSMHLPTYNTEKIGPGHAPSFKCMVEVGSRTFYGVVCKTKKLAEMNAAKVAFNGLTQHIDTDTSADGKKKENSGIILGNNTNQQSTIGASNAMETLVLVSGGETGETTKNNQLSPSAKGKNKATMSPERVEADDNGHVEGKEPGTKKLKYSTSPEFPLINAVLHSSTSGASRKAVGESNTKVVIYPRESNVTIPDGASILPCSNDKWVVTRVEFDQDC